MKNDCKSGVYRIINLLNEKFYIGSTIDLMKRKVNHFNILKINKHKNKHLQNSWNKYGEENFKFEIIELVEDVNNLIDREQYYISKYWDSCKTCYNISPTAGNTLGVKMSEESKMKMSKLKTGKKLSEEHKKKISESGKGRKLTKENQQILIKANTGAKRSEETKKKMSKIHKGKKLSNETKYKISIANKGHNVSEETRRKVGEAHNKPIKAFKKDTNEFIGKYKSITECAKILNINLKNISAVLRGKRKSCGGYIFEYIF